MSFFSIPSVSPPPYVTATRTAQASAATAIHGSDDVSSSDRVTVDMVPASPPAEVLDAMATAARAQDRLAASGQALHLDLDETSGKVTAQVTDLSGTVVTTVSPSTVLEIAAGKTLS